MSKITKLMLQAASNSGGAPIEFVKSQTFHQSGSSQTVTVTDTQAGDYLFFVGGSFNNTFSWTFVAPSNIADLQGDTAGYYYKLVMGYQIASGTSHNINITNGGNYDGFSCAIYVMRNVTGITASANSTPPSVTANNQPVVSLAAAAGTSSAITATNVTNQVSKTRSWRFLDSSVSAAHTFSPGTTFNANWSGTMMAAEIVLDGTPP